MGQSTHINGQTDRRILFCQLNIQSDCEFNFLISFQQFPHQRISRCPSSGAQPPCVRPVKSQFILWRRSLLRTENVSTGSVSSVKPRAAGIKQVEVMGGHYSLLLSAPAWQRRISTSTRMVTTSVVNATTCSTDPGWALSSMLDFKVRLRQFSLFRISWRRARRRRPRGERGWPGRPRRGTGGGRPGRTRGSGWRWRRKMSSTSPSWRSPK